MRQEEGAGEKEGVLFRQMKLEFEFFQTQIYCLWEISAFAMVLSQVCDVWKATNTLLKLSKSMW